MIKALTLLIGGFLNVAAQAETGLPGFDHGMPYEAFKKTLIAQQWKPVNNQKISNSSLYAQELYAQGMLEVVDCVSMELDGCWFYYTKKNRTLEVRTITRQLKVEKITFIKSR
jgi:hypothetical protein